MKEKEEYWENKKNRQTKKEKIKYLRTSIQHMNKLLVSKFKKISDLRSQDIIDEEELELQENGYEDYLLKLNQSETMLINMVRNKYDSYAYRFIPSKIKLT